MESTRWDSAPSSSDSGCDGVGCDDGGGLRDSWIRYIPTLTSSSSSSSLDGVSNETLALGERLWRPFCELFRGTSTRSTSSSVVFFDRLSRVCGFTSLFSSSSSVVFGVVTFCEIPFPRLLGGRFGG